jgi:hypothetical protein
MQANDRWDSLRCLKGWLTFLGVTSSCDILACVPRPLDQHCQPEHVSDAPALRL